MTSDPQDSPGTRWGDREQRRADILRAGESLLVSGGYDALRMRDVATGAGISLGAVYTYYTNKESLFIAVFAERLEAMLAELEPKVAEAEDAVDAFIVTATMYRDGYLLFGRQFDALSLVTDEDKLQPEVVEQLRRATARMVTTLSSSLVRFGYEGDIPLAMTFLWSSMRGLANHYASARSQFLPVSWDEAVAFSAESLARSLRISPRA
ncbi:hypothetical protein nbrc107696_05320 [Gordonia spumicola]|uniref:HTH tetR-type domain-containing protein n=1 Tax=Gordonia spumicola TaxID=589161 RepID=A0A7I9V3U5_9ACTN|nr:TetR/AcrR family transcriptional regulator [Gordonia spumicola]GEE00086.1 hypothetical protein nbrc107696_05320 [Gordonia spumicola]